MSDTCSSTEKQGKISRSDAGNSAVVKVKSLPFNKREAFGKYV